MNLDFEERLDRAAAILVGRSGRRYEGLGGFQVARQDVAAVVDALQEAVRQAAQIELSSIRADLTKAMAELDAVGGQF
jgi:hypothetical protein